MSAYEPNHHRVSTHDYLAGVATRSRQVKFGGTQKPKVKRKQKQTVYYTIQYDHYETTISTTIIKMLMHREEFLDLQK